VEKPQLVGDWVVGRPFEKELEHLREHEFSGQEQWLETFFEECVNLEPLSRPELWVADNGMFRNEDWISASSLPRSVVEQLPSPVAEDSNRGGRVYALSKEQLKKELRFLRCLALIRGAVRSPSSAALRRNIELAYELGREKSPAEAAKNIGGAEPFLPSLANCSSRELKQHACLLLKSGSTRLRDVYPEISFERNGTPSINLVVRSTLELLYCHILSSYTGKWKRCSRPDCPRVFAQQTKKTKHFCSDNCYHLDYMRGTRGTKVAARVT
jgi:hypothetical protein